MIHAQMPPIGAEVWRNMMAAEIQSNPLRYVHSLDDIDPEAKALAAGELARHDFDGPETTLDESEPADNFATASALLVAGRFVIGVLAVAVIALCLLAFVTQSEWRY